MSTQTALPESITDLLRRGTEFANQKNRATVYEILLEWSQQASSDEGRLESIEGLLKLTLSERVKINADLLSELLDHFISLVSRVYPGKSEEYMQLDALIEMHGLLPEAFMGSDADKVLLIAIGNMWVEEETDVSVRAFEYLKKVCPLQTRSLPPRNGKYRRQNIILDEVISGSGHSYKGKRFSTESYVAWISRGMPKEWITVLGQGWLKTYKVEDYLRSIANLWPLVKITTKSTRSPFEDVFRIYLEEDVFPEIELHEELHACAMTAMEDIKYVQLSASKWVEKRHLELSFQSAVYVDRDETTENVLTAMLKLRKKFREHDFVIDAILDGSSLFPNK